MLVFFEGDLDVITMLPVVRSHYATIRAPTKRFVALADAGHLAIFRARDAFLDALIREVVPVLQD